MWTPGGGGVLVEPTPTPSTSNFFNEFLELWRTDDLDYLRVVGRHVTNQAQAPTHRLLREDVGVGGERAKSEDHRDVSDVPAFAKHEDRDDDLDFVVWLVDGASGFPGFLQGRSS